MEVTLTCPTCGTRIARRIEPTLASVAIFCPACRTLRWVDADTAEPAPPESADSTPVPAWVLALFGETA